MADAAPMNHEPHYVPPPPPAWLWPLLAVVLLGIGSAVVLDVRDDGTGPKESVALAAAESPSSTDGESASGAFDDDTDHGGGNGDSAADSGLTTDGLPEPQPSAEGEAEPVARYADDSIDGLLTFRGNPTRSFHGTGPVPTDPDVLWSSEIGCSTSYVGSEPREWCGTGWTGQPLVFAFNQRWTVAVGGYNRSVNFYDPNTGDTVYPRFETGDIIKGTATIDPDGYPLLYTGSRDNYLHVVALDGDEPRELWRLSAESDKPTLWNNDWDGSPLVLDDRLIVGGENSRFYVVQLNRGYDAAGRVTVDPDIVFDVEGWDDQLLADLGDHQVSIENSVAVHGSVAYFANSGGLVQGWDLAPLDTGATPERVFRYWTGDDTDATIVVGDEGELYVGVEYERNLDRASELGQVFRLDPSNPDDPLIWSVAANDGLDSGVWATPALWEDLVIVATDDGRVLGLDRATGDTHWTLTFEGPVWSSPVVVDDVLIQGDCTLGVQAFDLLDAGPDGAPELLWSIPLDGCVESTPAVWEGRIYVGTRAGFFHAIGDPDR